MLVEPGQDLCRLAEKDTSDCSSPFRTDTRFQRPRAPGSSPPPMTAGGKASCFIPLAFNQARCMAYDAHSVH